MFLSLQRRHFEQVKVAVPIIVKVLKARSLELEDEDPEFKNLFDRAMSIANSIRAVCVKLVCDKLMQWFFLVRDYAEILNIFCIRT